MPRKKPAIVDEIRLEFLRDRMSVTLGVDYACHFVQDKLEEVTNKSHDSMVSLLSLRL